MDPKLISGSEFGFRLLEEENSPFTTQELGDAAHFFRPRQSSAGGVRSVGSSGDRISRPDCDP